MMSYGFRTFCCICSCVGALLFSTAKADTPQDSASEAGNGWTNLTPYMEVRGGLSNHDMQTTSNPFEQEEGGFDLHLEYLSPSLMGTVPDFILNPRIHAGVSLNSEGETSRLYGGLTWEFALSERWAFEFGFGGGVHDGQLDQPRDPVTFAEIDDGRPALGSRFLFREEFALSYKFSDTGRVVVFYEHYSNGGLLDDRNEGLDQAGIKIGFGL